MPLYYIGRNSTLGKLTCEDIKDYILDVRVDPPLQEGDILKKIDGKWYLIKGGIAYEYEEVAE